MNTIIERALDVEPVMVLAIDMNQALSHGVPQFPHDRIGALPLRTMVRTSADYLGSKFRP
jgi:hypothetical protein